MQSDERPRLRPTRRQIITAGGASALALTTGVGFAQRPTVASGRVFHDRSGTGRRMAGDPGIAGAMVSNGRDVVVTDIEGRWRLPVADGDSVFVIKPPHWATPAGIGGVPHFSHLHHPQGSPKAVSYRHAGVAPTGALPTSIDFPLRRQEERGDFEVALLADTQPENGAELGYLRDDIVAGVLGCGAAFGINHGDVVFDDLSLYPRYLQILGASGIPWHHCPGNHDINSEARDDGSSRETWKRVFGPRHYAFQYAGATFIMLDNVHYFGHNPGWPDSGRYCGQIGKQQLQFVRNVLANVPPEQLVVLSMHIPLLNYLDPSSAANNTIDRRALLGLLASRPHTVSFSGHMHLTEHHYLGAEEGFHRATPHHHHILTAASGSWWSGHRDSRGIPSADSQDGTPNGFHVLSVDGCVYTTRFLPAVGKAPLQLRAIVDAPHRRDAGATIGGHSPGAIPRADLDKHELIVNVFDGGPATRVSYQIAVAGPQPIPMQRAAISDPLVARLYAQHASMQKPWVCAVPSSHVWKAALPAGLRPGAHRITVEAQDEYGRRLGTHLVVEVVASGESDA
jgi:C terminal of Calcineurin-like phosphoesterase/Calcineurin-like phosphoesterase